MARRSLKLILSALVLVTTTGLQASGYRAQILPDMMQHLDCARTCLHKGEFEVARAHTDIILLNRDLKVFVDTGYADRENAALCEQALDGAITMWENALGGEVHFLSVREEKEADIVVRFESNVLSSRGQEVGGNVNWTRSIVTDGLETRGVVKATIKVRTYCPGRDRMTLEQMRHVACHELGHVLGLGDSPRVGDIMGPLDLRRPATVISIDEVQALREVRDTASDLRREATNKVLLRIGRV
jgi:predicted Zn-dependent protease